MAISNGITRVYGDAVTPNPVTLHGGYPLQFLKVVDSSSGFTADTVDGNGKITAEGGFTIAIRAIQNIATIVYIGTRANGQFVVGIDASTINTYVSANTDTNVPAAVDAAIVATSFGDTITVTDISGLVAGNLA
jgi:hypothetical protein